MAVIACETGSTRRSAVAPVPDAYAIEIMALFSLPILTSHIARGDQ